MNYQQNNQAKADFNNVYHAATPHQYFALMNRLDYRIGEEASPYFRAAIDLLRRQNDPAEVQMLDVGCSYGVGSALVKHRFSFNQIANFFKNDASRDYAECVQDTRQWLKTEAESSLAIQCVGMDCSEEALQFAEEAELLDAGISKNFEENEEATEAEIQLMRHCNLMTSTGAIGYITEKTLGTVLSHLGKALPEQHGPYIVVTILRMFHSAPIRNIFQHFGFQFERMPGIRLRQRQFADETEQRKTIRVLKEHDVDPTDWESEGHLYANLFAAAPEPDFPALKHIILETRDRMNRA